MYNGGIDIILPRLLLLTTDLNFFPLLLTGPLPDNTIISKCYILRQAWAYLLIMIKPVRGMQIVPSCGWPCFQWRGRVQCRGRYTEERIREAKKCFEIIKTIGDVDLDEPVVATNSSLRTWLQLGS